MIEETYTCYWCNKEFIKKFKFPSEKKYYDKKERSYCSKTCSTRYRNSIYPSGMKGKTFSPESRKKISDAKKGTICGWKLTSKAMNERQKLLGTGFYNSELQSELSRRANKSHGGRVGGKKSIQILHKRYLDEKVFNGPFYQKMLANSRRAIARATEVLRENQKQQKGKRKFYFYSSNRFYSKGEMNFAKFLLENDYLNELRNGENYNISIGRKFFDFLINGVYVEFHPFWNNKIDQCGRTPEVYFNERRTALNEQGITNKLLVVTSIKDFIKQYSEIAKT